MRPWAVLVADLRSVGPAPATRTAALRAGATLALPLLVLWAVGRLDLGVYATFGAFTAVYGGAARYDGRWPTQVACGLVLLAAVTSGTLVSATFESDWAAVVVAAVWASVAAAASDRWQWVPPGPMFVVFAVAGTASVPIAWESVPAGLLACLAAVALGLGLGLAEERVLPGGPRPPPPVDQPRSRRRIHAVRCFVVVAVAGGLMTWSGLAHPYWAMTASVVPLARPGLTSQLARGAHRVLGTVVGLGLAGVLLALRLPGLVTVLLLGLLQGLTERVVTRHYATGLVLITPLALLAVQLADPQPVGQLLLSRLAETAVGAGVGMAAAYLTRQRT